MKPEGNLGNRALSPLLRNLDTDRRLNSFDGLPIGPAVEQSKSYSEGLLVGNFKRGDSRLPKGSADHVLVCLDGKPHIQAAGGRLDDMGAGSGYRAIFVTPITQIQFEIVGGAGADIEIEVFRDTKSMGEPLSIRAKERVMRFEAPSVFDAIEIRARKGGPGWGLKNIGIAGFEGELERALSPLLRGLATDRRINDFAGMPVGPVVDPDSSFSEGVLVGDFVRGRGRLATDKDTHVLVCLDGKPFIQTHGGALDNMTARAGYRATFVHPVTQIQFEVVGAPGVLVDVETYRRGKPLGPALRVRAGEGLLRFASTAGAFDAIEVRAVDDGPGWGLAKVGIAGFEDKPAPFLKRMAGKLSADQRLNSYDDMPIGPVIDPDRSFSEGMLLGRFTREHHYLPEAVRGNVLVSLGGRPYIQGAGGCADGLTAGAGYRATFKTCITEIQFQVVADPNTLIDVEAFRSGKSLGGPLRIHGIADSQRFYSDSTPFDAIEIRAVEQGPGWGLRNVGIGGFVK